MKNFKLLFSLLTLLVLTDAGRAQEVQDLGSRLFVMRGSADAAIKNEADHLNSLVYDSHPTLYGQDGQFIRTGEQFPVRLIVDISTMQLLNTPNSLFSDVEIICIKVEKPSDLNFVLKLADLAGFAKLKYICFQYSFQPCPDQLGNSACALEKISGMVQGGNVSGLKTFYSINIDN
jgi:hypothetical protein